MEPKLAIDFEKLLKHHPEGLGEAALWIVAPVPMAAMHLAKHFLGTKPREAAPPSLLDVIRAGKQSGAAELTITMKPERALGLEAQLSSAKLPAVVSRESEREGEVTLRITYE